MGDTGPRLWWYTIQWVYNYPYNPRLLFDGSLAVWVVLLRRTTISSITLHTVFYNKPLLVYLLQHLGECYPEDMEIGIVYR